MGNVAGPSIGGELYEQGLHPGTLQPPRSESGRWAVLHVRGFEEPQTLFYGVWGLFSEALEDAVPLVYDEEEDGWSVTVRVPGSGSGSGGTVAGQDAKGLKPERFAQQEKICKKGVYTRIG